MADLIGFCQRAIHCFYSAGAAFTTFNHRVVTSLIQASAHCYSATLFVLRGLGTALTDILFYISDFVFETGNVVVACFRLLGKFVLLVYYILSAAVAGLLFLLGYIGLGISYCLTCLNDVFHLTVRYFSNVAENNHLYIKQLFSQIGQYLLVPWTTLSDTVGILALTSLNVCVNGLNAVGEIFIDVIQYLVEYILNSVYAAFENIGWFLGGLKRTPGSLLEICTKLFCSTVEHLRYGGMVVEEWLWSRGFWNIPPQAFLYVVGTTIIIILFKMSMERLHRQGMTFPMFHFRSSRILHPHTRRMYFIDSSDEDSTYEERGEEEIEGDYIDLRGHTALDDAPLIAMPPEFEAHTSSDSDDSDGTLNQTEEDPDDSEDVDEFEIASDSESDSDAGSVAAPPIHIELPERGVRYFLRARSSPLPVSGASSRLSPGELEKVLENERDKRICVVCQDQLKTVLVLPCRHMCLCVECAHEIANQRNHVRRVCPLCRGQIETVMNVFV